MAQPHSKPADPNAATFDVSTRLALWLETFRIFLNTTETEIKRRHGAESDINKQWTFWKGDLFDRFLSYRLFYHLRNRSHEALPSIWFSSGMRYNDTGQAMMTSEVALDSHELLQRYRDWKPVVRADLEAAGTERLALLPLVEDHQVNIQKLATHLMRIELPGVLKHGQVVLDHAKEAMGPRPDPRFIPVVFHIDATATFPVEHVSLSFMEPEKLMWFHDARSGKMTIQGELDDV